MTDGKEKNHVNAPGSANAGSGVEVGVGLSCVTSSIGLVQMLVMTRRQASQLSWALRRSLRLYSFFSSSLPNRN